MKERKMNNKGFSLVELIIVIAIMAILIVVLAPQYLKYVERSRNSTDLQNATTIKTAIETYAADPDSTKAFAASETFTVTIGPTATGAANIGVITTDVTSGAVAQAISDAGLTIGDIKCSSKTKWTYYQLNGTVQSNGTIKWNYTSDNSNSFSAAMEGKSGS